MLVLARQRNERIVLPTVPATIEIVAIRPNGVRLGIDAPPEVVVLREEVLRRGMPLTAATTAEANAEVRLAQVRHVLRNRLHAIALSLELLRRQLPSTESEMIHRVEDEVRALDQQLRSALGDSLDEPLATADRVQPVLAD